MMSSKPKRVAQIHFFVSDEERAAFFRAADARGLALSAWFRLIAREAIERQKPSGAGEKATPGEIGYAEVEAALRLLMSEVLADDVPKAVLETWIGTLLSDIEMRPARRR